MQANLAISIGLPVLLFIIMLGLGLSLRLADFMNVVARPKPLIIGLICQILVMPIICFGFVYISNLPPAIGVGMMLLAASPGGSSAMLFTHLAKGDVALSLCLVAITSLMTMLSLPVVAGISLELFYGGMTPITLGFHHVAQIFAIAIVPVILGIVIHHRSPALSQRLEKPVKTLATVFLIVIILFAVVGEWRLVVEWAPVVGLTVLAFSLTSLAVGYYVPRLFQVQRRQAIALAMGIGLHNAALVMTLALSEFMLDNPEMAIAPALYGVIAYIVCGTVVWLINKGKLLTTDA